MTDPYKDESLPVKLCRHEGGAKNIDIANASECLRVLADLFVSDDAALDEFRSIWLTSALRRRERTVRAALITPPDPED